LIHNDKTPDISVNPETHEVKVDGEKISCEPAEEIALAQRYFLF
jgi:urease subunit alpha